MKEQAERRRNERLDLANGLGGSVHNDPESKRLRRFEQLREELAEFTASEEARFGQRQVALQEVTQAHGYEEVLSMINIAFNHSNHHELEPEDPLRAILKKRSVEKLFTSLFQSPLGFDPNANTWKDVLELSKPTDETSSKQIRHYLRIWRMPRSVAFALLDDWESQFPVDHVHIKIKKSALESLDQDMVSFIYAGASIASTAFCRAESDHEVATSGGGAYGKFFHFLQVVERVSSTDVSFGCYNIIPLSINLNSDERNYKSTPDNLWFLNPAVWTVERALIGAISRELGLNSAFGGKFVEWRLPEPVQTVLSEVHPHHPTFPSSEAAVRMRKECLGRKQQQLADHFHQSRTFAASEAQVPITRASTSRAAQEASYLEITYDETTLILTIGKDIPLRDAFGQASWYNQVAGNSPRIWRLAMDVAAGFLNKKNRTKQIFRKLDDDDITYMYGPFLDFWAVCVKHELVYFFYIIFLRALVIIRPRVIICSSDKVSTLLRKPKTISQSIRVAIEDLSVPLSTMMKLVKSSTWDEDRKWKGSEGGDFTSKRVGTIVVVQYLSCWSVMLIRFDGGYGAYRPEFQQALYELYVLLAAMAHIIRWHAERRITWSKDAAYLVAERSEATFESIGLRALFEEKRESFLLHQNRFIALSALKREVYETDEQEYSARLAEYQYRGAQMSSIRLASLDASTKATGASYGPARRLQMRDLLAMDRSSVRVPCPPRLTIGSDEWMEWFMSRKEGCLLEESARSLKTSPEQALQLAATARSAIDWQRKKSDGPYPGYSSKTTPLEVFLWLCDLETFTFDRLAANVKGYMLVTCKICSLQGIIDSYQSSHYCRGPHDGDYGPAQSIRNSNSDQFDTTRLLIPAQLLHGNYATEILSAEMGLSLDVVRANHHDLVPAPIVVATRSDQRTANTSFLRLQIAVLRMIESNPVNINEVLRDTTTNAFLSRMYVTYVSYGLYYRQKVEGLPIAIRDKRYLDIDWDAPVYLVAPQATVDESGDCTETERSENGASDTNGSDSGTADELEGSGLV